MTAGEGRPERFGALVDAALGAWAARWPVYLGLAAASTLVQFAIDAVFRFDQVGSVLVLLLIDGFPCALASIDVAARSAGESPPLPLLFRAALSRWPVVSVLMVLLFYLQYPIQQAVFGSAEQTLYGALIVPGVTLLGVLALPTVVGSIETGIPLVALPGFALMRGIAIAIGWPNLGRLCLAGAMLGVPYMAQFLLNQWLTERHVAENMAAFWANVPIDAITLVPFQAFFTYFYLDLVARQARSK